MKKQEIELLEKHKDKVKKIRDALTAGVDKNLKLFTQPAWVWQSLIEKWQRKGWTDEEINQQLTYNLSYELSMARQWQQQKKLKKRIKTKKEIEPRKDKALTISERSVNYLFGQLKLKGVERYGTFGRELDYRLMWAVDFISSEISTRAGFSRDKEGELVLFENASQFFNFTKRLKEFRPALFKFKASDVRKYLGFSSNKMSIKDVVDLFRGLQRVIFEAEGEPILRDAEKGEWAKTTVSSSLYSMKKKELKKTISNRWQTKDVRLTLRFDSVMGWLFLANLSCGRAGRITLPKKARHELDGYQQNILRELRLWPKPKPYNIIDLAKIAGFRNKNIRDLRKSLVRALEGLKQKQYIKDFEITGKGKEAKLSIFK